MKCKVLWRFLLSLVVLMLYGCAGSSDNSTNTQISENGKLNVTTTLFPYYDFVKQIAGDKVNLTMVLPAGMDSHSFEPTPADMITIQTSDLLIYNGGVMEHWLTQVLAASDTTDMTAVAMIDYVDTVTETLVEGMESDIAHEHEDGEEHDEHEEYDEHIWTSPVNAGKIVVAISEVLKQKDPSNRQFYETNTEAYLKKLKELDQEFVKITQDQKRNMIVIGDKFPFRYLAEQYGWDYRAAFSGCSTDTEPSAKTIAYLIDMMKSEGIPVIYYLELSSHLVSEIIAEETGVVPLLLHSCHNVTRSEFENGITYLQLMQQNAENLRKGLVE